MQEKMRPPVDTESQTASCPSSYRGDPTQSVIADIFAILPGSQVITWRMWFLLVSPTFLFLHFSFQLDGNEDISIVNSQTMHRCDKKLQKMTIYSHQSSEIPPPVYHSGDKLMYNINMSGMQRLHLSPRDRDAGQKVL